MHTTSLHLKTSSSAFVSYAATYPFQDDSIQNILSAPFHIYVQVSDCVKSASDHLCHPIFLWYDPALRPIRSSRYLLQMINRCTLQIKFESLQLISLLPLRQNNKSPLYFAVQRGLTNLKKRYFLFHRSILVDRTNCVFSFRMNHFGTEAEFRGIKKPVLFDTLGIQLKISKWYRPYETHVRYRYFIVHLIESNLMSFQISIINLKST